MKNKKVLYILLPLAIIIWGVIIYRIYTSLQKKETKVALSDNISSAPKSLYENEEFTLEANYRDPFLGQKIEVVQNKLPNPKPISNPEVKPVMEKIWPNLVYKGIIKNLKSSKQMILMEMNGNEFILKGGDTINGLQLKRITKDSILVAFGKDLKTFYK